MCCASNSCSAIYNTIGCHMREDICKTAAVIEVSVKYVIHAFVIPSTLKEVVVVIFLPSCSLIFHTHFFFHNPIKAITSDNYWTQRCP